MKKSTLVLAFLMIITMIVPALAAVEFPGSMEMNDPSSNGMYVISVYIEGQWKEAGSLSFDKFQSKKTIGIGEYLKSSNT